jgi:acetyltransferase
MVASARPAGYASAIQTLLADPAIDTVVPIFVPPFGVQQQDIATAIVSAAHQGGEKPMLAVLMGREGLGAAREQLRTAGIPAFIYPESAARALGALVRQADWASRPPSASFQFELDHARIHALINGARTDKRERLDELESLELLRACGIHTADAILVNSEDEIRVACALLDAPLAMKIVSPDITHKSDVGGVTTGLLSEEDVIREFKAIRRRVQTLLPGAHIRGVLLQREVSRGRELIAGITRDERFGALVMFGLGGVLVEALRDTVFRLAPLTRDDATGMLAGIRGARTLGPFRGQPAVDHLALENVIGRLSQLAEAYPDIIELDVNPLIARPSGVIAVDARVRLAPLKSL